MRGCCLFHCNIALAGVGEGGVGNLEEQVAALFPQTTKLRRTSVAHPVGNKYSSSSTTRLQVMSM